MSEPKEPTEQEQQTVVMLGMYKQFHEMGLNLRRRLEELDALPPGPPLFMTRKERRRGMPE